MSEINNVFVSIFIFLLLTSCSKYRPQSEHGNGIDTVATVLDIASDTTKILVAGLPTRLDSVEHLLYPIQLVNLEERNHLRLLKSGSYSDHSYSNGFNHTNGYTMAGNFVNIIFEDKEGNRKKLTNHVMSINQATFLIHIYNETGKGYILYTVYDRDTNGDGSFNRNDFNSLYISNADGSSFTKVTKELHNFQGYKTFKDDKALYFNSIEDSNRDGKISNDDTFHAYKIDFSRPKISAEEYNPLEVFE